MKCDIKLQDLENQLGLNFSDKELLKTAITHSSFANQKKKVEFNERLEFLGDSVLQLIISEYLYTNFTEKYEGYLTKIRSLIVCENSLCDIASGWNLGMYMNMSKGEEITGGRNRVSILADCVEAVIAAVYLDSGIEYSKTFILTNFKATIDKAISNEIVLDYKTKLQEILQQNGEVHICYELVKFEGPPHKRKFFVDVLINGSVSGSGQGLSKKEAEQNAAKEVMISREDMHE
ncbi:ribonuclease III [Clostridium tagluense]|uniref:ribonuclease III n=1 Tax=Clostridium tagluense TaxID=360422 RepID=UPI001C0DD953|nr:ribonuclease III [Clostridium tagluense]MBU3126501.1 ribonuclease III [Clostridium tagluense]MCB2309869.1 ribonuclease III [Clostridium tagluense]MCB2314601.1 ribonuclease III [Clostridium tagluense]MCB2319449.1 ribonuclease III [Clostridium tagluense]MCB2324463.1 ribonuclease III [Clostridium tagluense]